MCFDELGKLFEIERHARRQIAGTTGGPLAALRELAQALRELRGVSTICLQKNWGAGDGGADPSMEFRDALQSSGQHEGELPVVMKMLRRSGFDAD